MFEALLASYKGSLGEVLRHVQVERYFISRRYRVGAVTIGPQLSVDAGERQITADRSLAALPTSLQATTLFEAYGELIDAAGGLLEFSDLLKRPLDAFKYLQISIETGEAALGQQNVQLNCVMIGSANEVHLERVPRAPRVLELPRAAGAGSRAVPAQLPRREGHLRRADRAASAAPRRAARHRDGGDVRRPDAHAQAEPRALPARGGASGGRRSRRSEKMDLFAFGITPERLDSDAQKLLRANIDEIYRESDAYPIYEGRIGASPREMRTVLLDAGRAKSTSASRRSPS